MKSQIHDPNLVWLPKYKKKTIAIKRSKHRLDLPHIYLQKRRRRERKIKRNRRAIAQELEKERQNDSIWKSNGKCNNKEGENNIRAIKGSYNTSVDDDSDVCRRSADQNRSSLKRKRKRKKKPVVAAITMHDGNEEGLETELRRVLQNNRPRQRQTRQKGGASGPRQSPITVERGPTSVIFFKNQIQT